MFRTDATLRLQHTDAAGVMFFVRVYELMHVAYEELMAEIGHPLPADMARAELIIPIAHSEADYRQPLRLGDRLEISVAVTRLGSRSFWLETTIEKEETVAAVVRTVHVVVDGGTGRATTMPDSLREGLARYRSESGAS